MRRRYKGFHRVSYKGRTWLVKKRKTNAPQWVLDLAQDVVKSKCHKRMPIIIWRKRHGFHSTGVTYSLEGRITVRAGSDEQDQKLVLLHELAHYLCPKACGHNMRFWKTAWTLYKEYNIDLAYAFEREKDYKKKAIVAYNKIILKGGE